MLFQGWHIEGLNQTSSTLPDKLDSISMTCDGMTFPDNNTNPTSSIATFFFDVKAANNR